MIEDAYVVTAVTNIDSPYVEVSYTRVHDNGETSREKGPFWETNYDIYR